MNGKNVKPFGDGMTVLAYTHTRESEYTAVVNTWCWSTVYEHFWKKQYF